MAHHGMRGKNNFVEKSKILFLLDIDLKIILLEP